MEQLQGLPNGIALLAAIVRNMQNRMIRYRNRHDRATSPTNRLRWGIKANTTRECINEINQVIKKYNEP